MSKRNETADDGAQRKRSLGSMLYHLRSVEIEIDELYEASLGEETDQIAAFEAFAERRRDEVVESLARYAARMDSRIAVGKAEIERVRERVIEQSKRRGDWARDRLREVLESQGVRKVEAGVYTVRLNKPRGSVVLAEGAAIPDEVKITETRERLDKKAARKILDEGGTLDGVSVQFGPAGVSVK